MSSHSVAEVQREGTKRFTAITFEELCFDELAENSPNAALFTRTKSAQLGEVDAFCSHSWSDLAKPKWAAWQTWRGKFKRQHGREPKVWIDKCFIDQKEIEANSFCLPIFLAGCQRLLLVCGQTYLQKAVMHNGIVRVSQYGGNDRPHRPRAA